MKLYTVGYERSGQAALVRALTEAGVAVLIDVRELPNSRRAGFSKRALSAALADAGLRYVHLKALGTPKEGRTAARAGRMKEFWSVVDRQLDTDAAREALDDAARIAEASTACLLCLEADHRVCHRDRVAALMAERYGFEVEHLAVTTESLV